jgi:bifunctional non-homologous end joining protein LigD
LNSLSGFGALCAPASIQNALRKLLVKSGDGIQVNEHLAREIGPAMFEHVWRLGLEGIVSKHRDRAYRAGRSRHWIKVKNPDAPAMRPRRK